MQDYELVNRISLIIIFYLLRKLQVQVEHFGKVEQ